MEKGLHLPSIAEYANYLDMTYKVVQECLVSSSLDPLPGSTKRNNG